MIENTSFKSYGLSNRTFAFLANNFKSKRLRMYECGQKRKERNVRFSSICSNVAYTIHFKQPDSA